MCTLPSLVSSKMMKPTLYPRHHAITPLPPRPLLLLDNLVYNAPWTNNANANPADMTVPPATSSRDNIGDLHNTDVARAIPTLSSTTPRSQWIFKLDSSKCSTYYQQC